MQCNCNSSVVHALLVATHKLTALLHPCSAGLGGGGAKALAGTIVMQNVTVVRNSAADGGAFEVAKQEGSNLFPTMLLVNVGALP